MADQNIINYLSEGLQKGYDIKLLKQKLLESGYNDLQINEAVNSIDLESNFNSESLQKNLGIFSKIGKALAHPTELFQLTQSEGIFPALKYQIIILLVPLIIVSILIFLFFQTILFFIIGFFGSLSGATNNTNLWLIGSLTTIPFILFFTAFILIGIPVFTFVGTGILHLFVKLYGGNGTYGGTYKAMIYSSTPTILFGFIPILNILFSIWTFILVIFGVSINHKISKLRSFLASITPAIIILILIFILAVFIPTDTAFAEIPSNPQSGESGEDNFNFTFYDSFTTCTGGRIKVYAKNLGQNNMSKEDWKIHKIDGKNVDIWIGADLKNVNENFNWGMVMWPRESYSIGKHIVELGTSTSNTKTLEITCN